MMVTHAIYNLMLGEDEDLERRAMQRLIEQCLPNIKLVGTAATTSELLIWTHQKQPHLKVILLADYDEERFMESCLRFGAFAYLMRPVPPARMQQVLAMAAHML